MLLNILPLLNMLFAPTVTLIYGHICWNRKRRLPFIVCRPIPSAENKQKLPFSVSFRFCHPEIWRHEDGDVEEQRQRHGDMETWKHGETWTLWRRNFYFFTISTAYHPLHYNRFPKAEKLSLKLFFFFFLWFILVHRRAFSMFFVHYLGVTAGIEPAT